jgi:hypothetical protein
VFVRVLVSVGVGVAQRRLSYGHHKPAVLNAFQTNQATCKSFNLSGFAVHNKHFKTGFVVEMGVAGRDHQFMVALVQICVRGATRPEAE